MRRTVGLPLAAAVAILLVPLPGHAQVQPHRAEYALRLGAALNAPRVGTAVQELTQDCGGWRIKRDIKTEIAITSSWKFSVESKLDGQEGRGGSNFRFRTVQIQNGAERETKGRVVRQSSETRAEILAPESPPQQFALPVVTMMPVEAMGHLVERLASGAASFPAITFDAEVIGDAFLVDVTELDPGAIRAARPSDKPVAVPAAKSWPVFMSFTRGRRQDQRPLFTVNALVFDSGVLDRLTVETGLVSVTADLLSLKMLPKADCPRS
jgi:hypothetical protein